MAHDCFDDEITKYGHRAVRFATLAATSLPDLELSLLDKISVFGIG